MTAGAAPFLLRNMGVAPCKELRLLAHPDKWHGKRRAA
jgi:hypothetical protein